MWTHTAQRASHAHGPRPVSSRLPRACCLPPPPQVWKPKEAQAQTRVTKGQSMPKKLQYVAGLRGAPNVKMNVVRLEMDLGQPHQH